MLKEATVNSDSDNETVMSLHDESDDCDSDGYADEMYAKNLVSLTLQLSTLKLKVEKS